MCLILLTSTRCFAFLKDNTVFKDLDHILLERAYYDSLKLSRINVLRQELVREGSLIQQYQLYNKLYQEFMKLQADSAIVYARRSLKCARQIGDQEIIALSSLKLAQAYSTRGDYLRAKDILDSFDVAAPDVTPAVRTAYYENLMTLYSRYGSSIEQERPYYHRSRVYIDSLLSVLDPHSLRYAIMHAELGVSNDSLPGFVAYIFDEWHVDSYDRAYINYLMGRHYNLCQEPDSSAYYFALSAIDDIRNGTKDCSSLYNLAMICLNNGKLDDAYRYAQCVIDDADTFNAHSRKRISSVAYSIINQAYMDMQALQNRRLKMLVAFICLLVVCLTATVIYIYRQMRLTEHIRGELAQANQSLSSLNEALSHSNHYLSEANALKEKYIAHFFNTCSAYIDKLDSYQKRLDILAKQRDMDGLLKLIRSTSIIEQEIERLYQSFDEIFLHIYPTFVNDFNQLLPEEDRIVPKEKELLTTELRIYALIRLGITDSARIASFLRFSTRTVYNYRSKIRGKALVSNDEFDNLVARIG